MHSPYLPHTHDSIDPLTRPRAYSPYSVSSCMVARGRPDAALVHAQTAIPPNAFQMQSANPLPKLPAWRPRDGRNAAYLKWYDALMTAESDLDFVFNEPKPCLAAVPIYDIRCYGGREQTKLWSPGRPHAQVPGTIVALKDHVANVGVHNMLTIALALRYMAPHMAPVLKKAIIEIVQKLIRWATTQSRRVSALLQMATWHKLVGLRSSV